jgi:hypothetical protein
MLFDSQSSNTFVPDSAHAELIVRGQFHFILSDTDDLPRQRNSHSAWSTTVNT